LFGIIKLVPERKRKMIVDSSSLRNAGFLLAASILASRITGCSGSGSCDASIPDSGNDTDTDTDTDTDSDTDTDTDTDADSDTMADAGGDTDSETEGDGGAGVEWCDGTSGLCWEDPPIDDAEVDWEAALSYCDGLAIDGHDDWRLPTISELRTIIRGCDGTETGGACGVTDSCFDIDACWDSECLSCANLSGPGEGGCDWPAALEGACTGYWSSSDVPPPESYYAWFVFFYNGAVAHHDKGHGIHARCVRDGP
jgi:hypothetical protein